MRDVNRVYCRPTCTKWLFGCVCDERLAVIYSQNFPTVPVVMAATRVTELGRMSPDPGAVRSGEPGTDSRGSTQSEAEDPEVVLEGEELFMTLTPEQEAAWREMMQEREATVKSRKEQYTKWCDGFSRRRMFAYSRVRKLQEGFRQRANFYGELSAYISAVESKAKANRKPGTVMFQESVDGVDAGQNGASNGQQSSIGGIPEQPQDQTQQQQQQPQEQAEQHQGQQEKQQAGENTETKSEEETVTVKQLLPNAQ